MNSYSLSGDDLLLWQYFGARREGFFVEVGANHPTMNSQTWLFAQQGWKGILVEPLATHCELLRQQRPESIVFNCALGAPEQRGRAKFNIAACGDVFSSLIVNDGVAVERVEEVEVRTLNDVLAEAGNPKIDFLSIDVEGTELQVLRGFDLTLHRPSVLLVEDWLHGLDLHLYLVRNGYRVVKRTGVNSWYVPKQQPFHFTSFGERLRLFRKMYLGLPFRKLKLARRSRSKVQNSPKSSQ